MIEKQYNTIIHFFHKDKGGEYIGHKWHALCGKHGIWRKHTTRDKIRLSEQSRQPAGVR
jgi:hypothetical protein